MHFWRLLIHFGYSLCISHFLGACWKFMIHFRKFLKCFNPFATKDIARLTSLNLHYLLACMEMKNHQFWKICNKKTDERPITFLHAKLSKFEFLPSFWMRTQHNTIISMYKILSMILLTYRRKRGLKLFLSFFFLLIPDYDLVTGLLGTEK